MKPLVSILIPAYNADKWIAETIQSAMGQTWQRKEIIVVHGRSCPPICLKKRRRRIQREPGGCGG
jgi:cellulose synthase/poly-beta-1,6-N-acetylglucosamine synthase-like glycosyltransferase